MTQLLDQDVAARVLARALANGGRFAEVFAERRQGQSLAIDEQRIESVQSGAEEGAGVRVVEGNTTYFAHVDGLDPADLERAADEAAAALKGDRREPQPLQAPGDDAAADRAPARRGRRRAEGGDAARARRAGPGKGAEIAQFTASYAEARRQVTVANSDGPVHRRRPHPGADRRPGGRPPQRHRRDRGGDPRRPPRLRAARRRPRPDRRAGGRKALTLLDAVPAPSGSMPVVVGGGFGGVLFHEMTGHGLEADHIQKGASVYVGKLGEQVAEPLLNAYDDGRLPGEWGSDAIDDEGEPTQKTQVIEDGRLTSYLYDHLTAERDGVASTGNGRRESFRHLPIPRMTNTYIAPGDATPEAMIAEVERGFYAVSFAGGQVDPATGDFVFGVSEGYLIEGGKVTSPCRGATLIGNCLEALAAIDAVGNDFFMKTGICGKGGQKVPVGTGQGHVRVRAMTVGGTEL